MGDLLLDTVSVHGGPPFRHSERSVVLQGKLKQLHDGTCNTTCDIGND